MRPIAMVVLLAPLVLAGCGSQPSQGQAPAGSPVTTSAPSEGTSTTTARPSASPSVTVPEVLRFSARTLDGKDFDGASLAGRPVVLWFWAPWCPKCRAQSAETAKVAEQFAGKATVVGVGGLDKTPKMRDFVAENKVDGFAQLTDESGAVWKKFEVVEQSTYVVLDRQGGVVHRGVLPNGSGLADKVRAVTG